MSGATQAPDLLTVGNFRKDDDVNGSGTRDTYVDFTFDQQADVASCCAGFQLVPVDGGAPIKALTVVDGGGTTTLTLAFEGKVKAQDIARGTVDKNIVRAEGAGSATNNPPQAVDVSNGGITADPDLVSVTRDGDQLLFRFDESIAEDDDVVQNTSGLRFYTANASTYSSSAVRMKEGTNNVLRAIYDLPQGVTLNDAIGGFVVAGTVVGNMKNPNELDEVAPIGDTGAGPTEAPDLLEVGNFRRSPFTSQFEPTTCVDFCFDQVAYLNGGGRSDFARGYVTTGVVNSAANNISAANPLNINQAANIEPNTLTKNPDLAQDLKVVERQSSVWLYFTFDEALTDDEVIQSTSGLRV